MKINNDFIRQLIRENIAAAGGVTLNDKPLNRHGVDADSELFKELESIAHEAESIWTAQGRKNDSAVGNLLYRIVDVLKDIEPAYDYTFQTGRHASEEEGDDEGYEDPDYNDLEEKYEHAAAVSNMKNKDNK